MRAARAARPRRGILFDGNSLLYGAYYGTPPLTSLHRNEPVNGVYTALRSVLRWLAAGPPGDGTGTGGTGGAGAAPPRPPPPPAPPLMLAHHYDLAAVCWDYPARTFRHDLLDDYKGQRAPTPDDLVPQFALAREAFAALGVQQFEAPGFEADDIIATLTRALASEHAAEEITVVSADKDLLQLVHDGDADEHAEHETTTVGGGGAPPPPSCIQLAHPFKRSVRGVAQVASKYGVSPDQLPGLFALVGDPADGVRGVAGVGIKIGARLMRAYGNVEAVAAAALALPPADKMTRKDKQAWNSQELRGLTLVRNHLVSGGTHDALSVLETVHRMRTDVPLVAWGNAPSFSSSSSSSPPPSSTASSTTSALLTIPANPTADFGPMLERHGFNI